MSLIVIYPTSVSSLNSFVYDAFSHSTLSLHSIVIILFPLIQSVDSPSILPHSGSSLSPNKSVDLDIVLLIPYEFITVTFILIVAGVYLVTFIFLIISDLVCPNKILSLLYTTLLFFIISYLYEANPYSSSCNSNLAFASSKLPSKVIAAFILAYFSDGLLL